MQLAMANHIWKEQDDITVLYITLYKYDIIPYNSSQISNKIGVSIGSLSYRIGNFKAIQGIGKAKNVAKLYQLV